MSPFDSARCKEVLGHFVTGVVIVTGLTSEGPVGFTCQTFGSLSVEPPSIFLSASIASRSWARIREVGVLGINVLRDDQGPLARVFATTGADKFAGVAWTEAPHGSPLLEGAIAHLEGMIRLVTNHGDHDIVVADLDFAATAPGAPLAFYRSEFRELA